MVWRAAVWSYWRTISASRLLLARLGRGYMPLSEAQIRDFYANGFVVVRQLAPRSAVEAVLAAGLAKRQWGLDGEGHQ